jgi:hypothetical protein
MPTSDHTKARRAKMIEHLESALALSDQLGDGMTGFLIESALDEARRAQLDPPPLPASLDPKRKG